MALEQGTATRGRAHAGTGAHPTPAEYVNIGLILGLITGIEVVVYYIDAIRGALVPILLILSAVKFTLVVMWFMHLRFDNALFSTFFTGALMLAAAIFIVVLATLGASLR
jgi:cytochrome c oxidase subunit 4